MKIYLAGPLFTVAERDFNARLAALLHKAGHEVFLPQASEERLMPAMQIFENDFRAIDQADVVVANMDGPDPDSGTCWECGYAWRKKPIILFRTDFRAAHEPGKAAFNLMLTESAERIIDVAYKNRELLIPADLEFVAMKLIDALAELAKANARHGV